MILEVLRQLIAEQFDVEPEDVNTETNLYEDLAADSLDMVELAMACEEEFDVEIEDSEENWAMETVGEFVSFLESHMEE